MQGVSPQWSELGIQPQFLAVLEAYEKELQNAKEQVEREVKLWLTHIGRNDPQTKVLSLSLTGCVKRANEMRLDSVVTFL